MAFFSQHEESDVEMQESEQEPDSMHEPSIVQEERRFEEDIPKS